MRAVVFGAGGGIGAALVEVLAGREDVEQVVAASRTPPEDGGKIRGIACDVTDEASIAAAAALIDQGGAPDLVIVASGALHFADGAGPERSYKALDPARMAQILQINTIAPAIVAKHMLPMLPREGRAVFAVLSARVGSIGDNGLGGWHSYRASKAALNMLVRNFAIELGRTHRDVIVAALHPGTVDTELSKPFQKNLPDGQVTAPKVAAAHLLEVISGLAPGDSGGHFAWDGKPVPW